MVDNAELTWVCALTFLIVSIFVVAARLYIRTSIRAIGWDDWAMLMCQTCFTTSLILLLVGVPHGIGKHRWELTDEQAEYALLLWLCVGLTYVPGTTLLKISVGLFVLRFVAGRRQRWTIIAMCLICGLFGVAYMFVIIFQCQPVSYWWASTPGAGKCMDLEITLDISYAAAAVNMVADLMFAAMPAWIVWHTRMNLRTRITLCILLGLGSIAVIATVIRVPFAELYREIYAKPNDFLWKITPIVILSIIEVGLGVVASSAATLRPLFEKCLTSRNGPKKSRLRTIRLEPLPGDKHTVTGCEGLEEMPDLPMPGQKSSFCVNAEVKQACLSIISSTSRSEK